MAGSNLGYSDTPVLPGTQWHVHDGERPQPPVVTPGEFSSIGRPSDAITLFDGTTLEGWESARGGDAAWSLEGGYMEVMPGTGDIQSRVQFGDCQLHLEWAAPSVVKGDSQGRGNSGVFLMGRYEIQVLDCYDNPTYPDGTTASIYGQFPPLVNACRKPGEWQTYDIIWKAPRFDGDRLLSPSVVTVIHNGIVVQNAVTLNGPTGHRNIPEWTAHPAEGPLRLQDHGDLVRFRNIWYRPL
jgi:hypothetical protein